MRKVRESVFSQLLLVFCMLSCSRMEEAEKARIRRCNEISERIYRHHNEVLFEEDALVFQEQPPYPWEETQSLAIAKVTKEYFRCRGSLENPERKVKGEIYKDCGGSRRHGLLYKDQQEFVYPVLIELLNYVQQKIGAKVVITSGYRCPAHNAYVCADQKYETSKHQVGAAVNFYVSGYEDRPLEVVKWIMDFYRQEGSQNFLPFRQAESKKGQTKYPGWYNKEIFIKIYDAKERRDFDNRHPYPYIVIEVRYDRHRGEAVNYDWKTAHQGYLRY